MLRSLTRIMIVAGGCLAIAAPAAQASPTGLTNRDGGWLAQAAPSSQASQASSATDQSISVSVGQAQSRQVGHRDGAFPTPAAVGQTSTLRGDGTLRVAQQPPVNVTVTKTTTEFSYLDAALGAVIAGGLFAVGLIAFRRPRPRATA